MKECFGAVWEKSIGEESCKKIVEKCGSEVL